MSISIKPSKTVNQTLTLLCDTCRTDTVHLVVTAIDYHATMHDDFRHWGTAQITKCQGCEEIAFRQVCYSEDHPDEADELLFPPRKRHKLADHLQDLREMTKWFLDKFALGSLELLLYVGLLTPG